MNEIVVFLASKLAKIFYDIIATVNFLVLWRTANTTLIPKGSSSQLTLDYRPISTTHIISMVDEKLISRRLYKLYKSFAQ